MWTRIALILLLVFFYINILKELADIRRLVTPVKISEQTKVPEQTTEVK